MTLPPETIKQIAQMWADGVSVIQIGRRLGISKNTVVGRIHRMGLPQRGSPIIRRCSEGQSERPLYYGAANTLPTLPSLTYGDL